MKKALCILNRNINDLGLDAKFILNVHDEFQLDVREDQADVVGHLAVESIKLAGEYFNLNCPLAAEYKVGDNWKETH